MHRDGLRGRWPARPVCAGDFDHYKFGSCMQLLKPQRLKCLVMTRPPTRPKAQARGSGVKVCLAAQVAPSPRPGWPDTRVILGATTCQRPLGGKIGFIAPLFYNVLPAAWKLGCLNLTGENAAHTGGTPSLDIHCSQARFLGRGFPPSIARTKNASIYRFYCEDASGTGCKREELCKQKGLMLQPLGIFL